MYSPVKLGLKYIQYWLFAENAKGHGVHSPFVFELIERVFNDDRNFYYFPLIESARESLTKSTLTPQKYDHLFFRMVNYFGSSVVLELGTKLGITTSYLAAANSNASVISLEKSTETATVAKRHFQYLGLKNIEQVIGEFDETLPVVLSRISQLDFVLVNGNYPKETTLHYFNQLKPHLHENSVLIFVDIHRNKEMETVWRQVQSDEMVTLTIDLFFVGLVFFRKENKVKQHFTVRY
ncbi:O-methyltransferase [Sediminibacterium sp. TEGAF015]|uniref:O-methyltransferase n=1 Tax=Sediminibacterium sp. TEGAF015 TaxID=575378 RepID=UPI002200CB0D|nr:class I SAM-dependent methyltransferase [Sediminibacterium sp. TEGAF015]BDQ11964.1 hypothetical protein TEGAF0_11810 [Sediminibacterium sp. TEGAF015]